MHDLFSHGGGEGDGGSQKRNSWGESTGSKKQGHASESVTPGLRAVSPTMILTRHPATDRSQPPRMPADCRACLSALVPRCALPQPNERPALTRHAIATGSGPKPAHQIPGKRRRCVRFVVAMVTVSPGWPARGKSRQESRRIKMRAMLIRNSELPDNDQYRPSKSLR